MATERLTLSIDTDLLKKLKAEAVKDDRSLSKYISRKLAAATAEETAKFIE